MISLFAASAEEAHESLGHLKLFVCGSVGSESVYEFTVTPLAPRPAESPEFLKVVSRMSASLEEPGIIDSL